MGNLRLLASVSALSALALAAACTGSDGGGSGTTGTPDAGGSSSSGDGGGTPPPPAGPGTSLVTVDPNAEALDEIRVDATDIYYKRTPITGASIDHASIEKMPIAGGSPTVLASDVPEPSMFVLDATHLYFARSVCAGAVTCGVFRVAKAGGAVQTLAEDPEGGQPLQISGLAVDDTYAYFGANLGDALERVKKDGSAAAEVLSSGNAGIRGIQTDAQYIYFVDATVGTVKFLRLAKTAAPGTTPDTLATLTGALVGHTPTNVRAVGITDTEIVWADTGDDAGNANQIIRLPKTPGGATTPILADQRLVEAIDVFNGDVWFSQGGSILKVPVAGGTPTTVVGYPASPMTEKPIVRDASGLYWITLKDIRRLTF